MRGIACTSDALVIQNFLDLNQEAAALSRADRMFLLHTFMRGSHVSVVQSLEFLLDNFDAIHSLVHPMDELFEGIHRHVRTNRVAELLDNLVHQHDRLMTAELRRLITNENLRGRTTVLGNNMYVQSQFPDWVKEHFGPKPDPGHASMMRGVDVFVLVILLCVTRLMMAGQQKL